MTRPVWLLLFILGAPLAATPVKLVKPGGGFCGGTVVAEGYVLTAAHCLENDMTGGVALEGDATRASTKVYLTEKARRDFASLQKRVGPHNSEDIAIVAIATGALVPSRLFRIAEDAGNLTPSASYYYFRNGDRTEETLTEGHFRSGMSSGAVSSVQMTNTNGATLGHSGTGLFIGENRLLGCAASASSVELKEQDALIDPPQEELLKLKLDSIEYNLLSGPAGMEILNQIFTAAEIEAMFETEKADPPAQTQEEVIELKQIPDEKSRVLPFPKSFVPAPPHSPIASTAEVFRSGIRTCSLTHVAERIGVTSAHCLYDFDAPKLSMLDGTAVPVGFFHALTDAELEERRQHPEGKFPLGKDFIFVRFNKPAPKFREIALDHTTKSPHEGWKAVSLNTFGRAVLEFVEPKFPLYVGQDKETLLIHTGSPQKRATLSSQLFDADGRVLGTLAGCDEKRCHYTALFSEYAKESFARANE